MATRRPNRKKSPRFDHEERIKRLALIAVVSDDRLLHTLVLKGGNALSIAYDVTTRASVDLDFSMEGEFPQTELEGIRQRIEHRLRQTFKEAGYVAFDVQMKERPAEVSPELASFWGGYALEFKVIDARAADDLLGNILEMRRHAMNIGPRGRARARDFLDIHDLVGTLGVDLQTQDARSVLRRVFQSKDVPLSLLRKVGDERDFHRGDWIAVVNTVRPGINLQDFDYYVDFVVRLMERLEPLGDK